MTNTDEKLAFSNEKAINCFILACSFVGARAMFAGNIGGGIASAAVNAATDAAQQIIDNLPIPDGSDESSAVDDVSINGSVTTYGAVMNPAIALGISFSALFS